MLSRRTLTLAAIGLLVTQVVTLAAMFGKPAGFILVETGCARFNEYVGVRAAGELALSGQPAKAYDWDAHLARQRVIACSTADMNYPWSYPPTYLMVAAVLASLPVAGGALAWLTLTLGGYLWVVARASGQRIAALWAAATPATFACVSVIHTGFWTAGLMGLALTSLAARPVLAGVCFGCLAMKPQLGLLVPVALIAGRHWRAMASTAATAAALAILSILCFGIEPWRLLVPQMTRVAQVIVDGRVPMENLVTVYGALRLAGLGHAAATLVQSVVTAALAIGVYRLWRSTAGDALKAAGLASASLLATPYLFTYDLPMLAVVAAFLVRAAGAEGLAKLEIAGLAASAGVLFFGFASLPAGVVANLLTAALVVRRVWPYVAPARRADTPVVAGAP